MFTLRVKQRGGASCSDSCPFVSIRGLNWFFQVKPNCSFQVHAFRGQKKRPDFRPTSVNFLVRAY